MQHVIDKKLPKILESALIGSVGLIALSAPISIAATQTAWAISLLLWLISLIYVRPRVTAVDLFRGSILVFVGWTLLSSITSYEPEISIRKMVSVVLVSIVFLTASVAKRHSSRIVVLTALLVAATASSLFAIGVFVVGKHLKVSEISESGALALAGLRSGDTIVSANGRYISSAEELYKAAANGSVKLRVYRYEVFYDHTIDQTPAGADAQEHLGIIASSRGRDMRAAGFYGHYTTFAEGLQLTLALVIGSLLAGFFTMRPLIRAALLVSAAAMAIALFLTVTRASWAGAAAALASMVFIAGSRKLIVVFILLSVPVGIAGFVYLQQKRNVSFVDGNDGSTTWRLTVWSEGASRSVSSVRNVLVGTGMDSLKKRWQEWGMFDNGNLPLGHLHSTPLQLAFERGYPTLIAWMVWMLVYLSMLFRRSRDLSLAAADRGVLIGAFGGTIGFLLSGLVHYNWGDSEVAMTFYLIMGLAISVAYGADREPTNETI